MDSRPDDKQTPEKSSPAKADQPAPPKAKKELPVISTPDDDIIAEEMADLFDEDRVTHQHGHSQPERD